MSCTDLDLFTRSSDRVSSRAQKLVAAFTGSSRIGCFLLRRARQFVYSLQRFLKLIQAALHARELGIKTSLWREASVGWPSEERTDSVCAQSAELSRRSLLHSKQSFAVSLCAE